MKVSLERPIRTFRRSRGLAGLLVLTLTFFLAHPPALDAAARLRLGTLVPKGSSYYKHLQVMGQEWQKATRNAVRLVIYPDGRMGGEAEMVRRMRNRQLQAGMLTAVGLAEIEPQVAGLQSIPMMFRSFEEVDYVGKRLQPDLEKRLEAKGFVVVFWADAGWVQFFTASPVTYPEDMKKLKIWTWAGNPDQVDLYKKAGFTPVPLETKDIVLSMQTKAVTAIPMPPTVAMVSQVDKLAPHMLDLNWAPLVGACIVTKSVWDKLTPAQQQEMRRIAKVTGEKIQSDGRREAEESIEAMKKRGLKVHTVTPDVEKKWRDTAEAFYPEIRERMVPAEVFDRVEELLKAYRASRATSP